MAKKKEEWKLRLPSSNEVFGWVEQLLGSDRLRVQCEDQKVRICRIPGRLRKKVWIRQGDTVLIKVWKVQSESRGDVVHKYTPTEASWLRKKGLIKNLPE